MFGGAGFTIEIRCQRYLEMFHRQFMFFIESCKFRIRLSNKTISNGMGKHARRFYPVFQSLVGSYVVWNVANQDRLCRFSFLCVLLEVSSSYLNIVRREAMQEEDYHQREQPSSSEWSPIPTQVRLCAKFAIDIIDARDGKKVDARSRRPIS